MTARAKYTTLPQHNEESFFVASTDLMTGFLFVFIIMLMFFAMQLKQTESDLTSAQETRQEILQTIQNMLKNKGIKVEIDEENGILRLPESLLFAKGETEIKDEGRQNLSVIAEVLAEILPCYTGKEKDYCKKSRYGGKLETVLIEGHTDSDQWAEGARFQDNWDLSAFRAVNTYRALLESAQLLSRLKNDYEQPALGVSGYGDTRPIFDNITDKGKAKNRRIDLRFIMETPRQPEIIYNVRDEITDG